MPVLLFLMLQYESFHTVFSAPESMSKRLRNCIIGKIPKVDVNITGTFTPLVRIEETIVPD